MKDTFNWLIVQNSEEHSRYFVITKKFLSDRGKKYIVVQNELTNEKRRIEVCPYLGTHKMLIKADFLKGIDNIQKWIVAKFYGGTILIEDRDF